MPPPVPPPVPILSGTDGGEGTVGEPFAVAPGTFVVPGAWPARPAEPGLLFRTLVVRARATAVVDTAPAPLARDWLAGVLALVEPAEVRWVVVTALDAARAGCVPELLAHCPRATVVVPGSGCTTLDVGDGQHLVVHDGTAPVPTARVSDGRGTASHGGEDRSDRSSPISGPASSGPAIAPPGGIVVEVPHRRVLWSDVLGGAFPAPVTDLSLIGDDDLRVALSHRPRPLGRDEVGQLAALAPRVLASPTAPLARGRGVDRVLRLLADSDGAGPSSTVVTDLLARLGPPPWTAPRSPS